MKPSLADLRAFVAVGDTQSFAAAAKLLHLSQPALSRRIAHLEDQVGVRLLDRTTRHVALTTLGQRFLGQVRNAVENLDRSLIELHDVAHLEAGDVCIGCVFSVAHHFLPEVISAYHARHPHVLVRIVEEGAEEVLEYVKTGEAEFAINYTGMHDPELEFTPLLKEPFVLACATGHPLANRKSIAWSELAEHPYALVSHASRNRVLIDQALSEVERMPRPVCEVRHISTLIGLVQSGLVVAVVPQLTLPRDGKSIVGIQIDAPAITRTIGMIRRKGRSLTPAAQAFAELLTRAIQAKRRRRASR